MSEGLVGKRAGQLGGTVYDVTRSHWSTVEGRNVPPMPLRLGTDNGQHAEIAEKIRAAGRYAYRSATMSGKEPDLDPDALVQNFIVGLLGYWTPDGLSSDDWANPTPAPPRVTIDLNDT